MREKLNKKHRWRGLRDCVSSCSRAFSNQNTSASYIVYECRFGQQPGKCLVSAKVWGQSVIGYPLLSWLAGQSLSSSKYRHEIQRLNSKHLNINQIESFFEVLLKNLRQNQIFVHIGRTLKANQIIFAENLQPGTQCISWNVVLHHWQILFMSLETFCHALYPALLNFNTWVVDWVGCKRA